MGNESVAVGLVVTVSLVLLAGATAAGVATAGQSTGLAAGDNVTAKGETGTADAERVSIRATFEGETVPWRGERLPAFVGDTLSFGVRTDSDETVVDARWQTTGTATVDESGTNATVTLSEAGETTLSVTATLADEGTGETRTASSPEYTLVATPEGFEPDHFDVTFTESPTRWERAGVAAQFDGLPALYRNLSQRLPLPESVGLTYAVDPCGGPDGCYSDGTIYMQYTEANRSLQDAAPLYRHELTHAAQDHGFGSSFGVDWTTLIEGHATYEQEPVFRTRPLAEKPSKAALFDFGNRLNYNHAHHFVSAFVARYGYGSLEELLRRSANSTVEEAFERTTGETFGTFYDLWRPTRSGEGPNAVRSQYPFSNPPDKISHKPRFVYRNGRLRTLGHPEARSVGTFTVSWDTDGDGTAEHTGSTVEWQPAAGGDHTVELTYEHGTATLSRSQTFTVSSVPLSPADPNGDGTYEDVNGDGAVDIVDVSALFGSYEEFAAWDDSGRFDFNADGTVDIVDVQWLFQEVAG
jgi:hypothetical protein